MFLKAYISICSFTPSTYWNRNGGALVASTSPSTARKAFSSFPPTACPTSFTPPTGSLLTSSPSSWGNWWDHLELDKRRTRSYKKIELFRLDYKVTWPCRPIKSLHLSLAKLCYAEFLLIGSEPDFWSSPKNGAWIFKELLAERKLTSLNLSKVCKLFDNLDWAHI